MPRKISRATQKIKAWNAFSKYIRTKASVDGMCQCVTCGDWKTIAETDAGHFVPKSRGNAVYFEEENVHPQCQRCNRFDPETSMIAYTRYIEDMYGPEKVDELVALAQTTKKISIQDLRDIESEFKQRLKELA